jgi:hypothetical protein
VIGARTQQEVFMKPTLSTVFGDRLVVICDDGSVWSTSLDWGRWREERPIPRTVRHEQLERPAEMTSTRGENPRWDGLPAA